MQIIFVKKREDPALYSAAAEIILIYHLDFLREHITVSQPTSSIFVTILLTSRDFALKDRQLKGTFRKELNLGE